MARGEFTAADFHALADFLSALGYPTRLELLSRLRTPRALADLRLSPRRSPGGTNPARAAARPTVLAHLNKLVEAGFLQTEKLERNGRVVPHYFVNHAKLYEVTEELRRLTLLHAEQGLSAKGTNTLGSVAAVKEARGPRLVLVHGIYEGRAYSLAPAGGGSRWVIGRRRDAAVSLDYDPFVSLEHAVVTQAGSDFQVTDLPSSKNGTFVNWRQLPRGGTQVLRPADIIGVGRSLLSFAPA